MCREVLVAQVLARQFRVFLRADNLEAWKLAPNNFVFLLDVSGSMQPPERLPLIKSALSTLVDQLRPVDSVAIVVSEETGAISVVADGDIERGLVPDTLRDRLRSLVLQRRATPSRQALVLHVVIGQKCGVEEFDGNSCVQCKLGAASERATGRQAKRGSQACKRADDDE